MRTSTRLRLVYAAAASVDTFLAGSPSRWAQHARVVTKPMLMPLLAGSLATSPRAISSPLRTSTLTALAFGWGGDVALLRSGTSSFAAGAGSFGVGHVAYMSGFVRRRDRSVPLPSSGPGRAAMRLWLGAAPVMALAAARQERALGPAVAAYTGLLAGTFATGNHLDPSLPASARRLTGLGAALFLVSDTVLGARKFLLPLAGAPSDRVDLALERVVMASYTAAQLLLAEGAARAGVADANSQHPL